MSYKITIPSINESYECLEDDIILDAGLNGGYNLPHSCRGGACGSCKAKLIEGEVEYAFQPMALSDDEINNNEILPCACLAKSDIALEFVHGDVSQVLSTQSKVQELPVKVLSLSWANETIAIIKLQIPKTKSFHYQAGQYIDFILRDGKRRSFSLANHPIENNHHLELHIRLIGDGRFTPRFFNNSIKKGDILRIAGPYGQFTLQKNNRPIIFLATGTGIAPIKGIIEQAIAEGYDSSMKLYWGARYSEDLYLHDLFETLSKEFSFLSYIPVLSRYDDDNWWGRKGYVYHAALEDIGGDFSHYDIYVSGRPVLIDDTQKYLTKAGMKEEHFFADAFEFAAN